MIPGVNWQHCALDVFLGVGESKLQHFVTVCRVCHKWITAISSLSSEPKGLTEEHLQQRSRSQQYIESKHLLLTKNRNSQDIAADEGETPSSDCMTIDYKRPETLALKQEDVLIKQ
jgi:hypothetical protein